jgi:hypothetical protein
MPGRIFEAGPGVTNIQADSGPLAHINLPTTSAARDALSSILRRASPQETQPEVAIASPEPAAPFSGNAEASEDETAEAPAVTYSAPPRAYIPRPGNMHISVYKGIINNPKANWPAKGCKPSADPCTWARATIENY